MRRSLYGLAALAAAALASCDRIEEMAADVAASQPGADEAEAAWIALAGVWAPEGACADPAQLWTIAPQAFHRGETHCAIERLEPLQNGVRAIAQCSVAGDDDRAKDVFRFFRRDEATLAIVNEANEAATDGLSPCAEELIP